MTQKNVVFLVLDSLRKDRTSIHNGKIDFTPTLQSIADSGKAYQDAVAQAPWTLPSHASMFTGQYPWEHGITQSKTVMDKNQKTFIQEFSEAGYETAAITPNVWITPHKGTTKDFDKVENFLGKKDNKVTAKISRQITKVFDGLSQDRKKKAEKYIDRLFKYFSVDDSCKSEETVQEAEKYLKEVGDEDFFLYINLMEPHEPYNPPKKYMEKHGVEDKEGIPDRQKGLFTQEIDYEKLKKIYDASTDYTDDLVARIKDSLAENNLDDDTVLIVISDHGQALGEDDIFGHQFTVDSSTTDTLMMIDDPEEEPGEVKKPTELRKLYDLTPQHAGIRQKDKLEDTEMVKGGYDYPSIFIGYVPEEKWDKYYNKYHYIQTDKQRTVQKINQDGETETKTVKLETGEETETPEKISRELDEITDQNSEEGESESGDSEEVDDEEIKERLEALGYK